MQRLTRNLRRLRGDARRAVAAWKARRAAKRAEADRWHAIYVAAREAEERRIKFKDLTAYKERRDSIRTSALDELARLGQEFDAF